MMPDEKVVAYSNTQHSDTELMQKFTQKLLKHWRVQKRLTLIWESAVSDSRIPDVCKTEQF